MEWDWCETRAVCREKDRWYCAVLVDWVGSNGLRPWGELDDSGLFLYLATMTPEEQTDLAEIAASNLDGGVWQGCYTPNGGWEDGRPWSEDEQLWRLTAHEFLKRYQAGDRLLTEGIVAYASDDLARELAWIRGWCPDSPWALDYSSSSSISGSGASGDA